MKKYKNAVPVLLIFLMALSIYSTFSSAEEKSDAKNEHLRLARENREKGVIQDALTCYQDALEIEEDFSLELEIGEMLSEEDMLSEAVKWGENLVEKFPKEKEGYSFLLKQYVAKQDYEECFLLNDKAKSTESVNQEFEEIMQSIAYLYEYGFEEYEEVTTFSAGIAAGMTEGKWKILKDSGSVTASGFLQAGFYNGEVLSVQTDEGWMYITADGNKKIDVSELENCEGLGMLIGDVFPAKCNGTYGYYNTQLEKLADGFVYASGINNGIGAVCADNKWRLVNSEGKEISDKVYEDIIINVRDIACQNERIWVSENGLSYYMIDEEENKIEGSEVENTKGFTTLESLAAVEQKGKWGFMDKNGKMVIEPQYEEARSFCNEYAAVKQNGKWGFINMEGTLVIEPQFEETKDFSNGNVFVKRADKWVLLKLYRNNYK